MLTGANQTDRTLARTVPLPGSMLLGVPGSAPARPPAGRSAKRPLNRASTRFPARAPIPVSTPNRPGCKSVRLSNLRSPANHKPACARRTFSTECRCLRTTRRGPRHLSPSRTFSAECKCLRAMPSGLWHLPPSRTFSFGCKRVRRTSVVNPGAVRPVDAEAPGRGAAKSPRALDHELRR